MLLEAASHLAALEEQHSPTDHATISASDPRVSRSNSSGDSRSSTAGPVPAAPAQGHGQLQQSHVHAHTQSDLLEDSELSALGAQLGTHEDPALACLGVAGTSGGHAGPGPAGLAIGLALSLGDAAAEGAQAARVAWLARSLAQLEERLAVEVRLCARLRERAACAVSIYDPADDQASKGNKWNAMTQDVLDANQQQGQPGSSSEMHSRPPLPRVSALGHQHAVGQQASSGQHAGQVSTFDALQHQTDQQPVHEQEPSMQHTAPALYIPEDKGAGAAQESHPQHEQLVIVLQPQQAVQQPQQAVQQPLPQPPLTPQQHLAQQQQLAEQQQQLAQQLAQQLTADTSGLSVQPLPPAATSPPQQHSLQAPNAAPRVLAPFQARPAARTAALSVSAASQEAEEAATGTAKAAAPSQPQCVAVPPVLTASTDPRVTSTFTSGSQPAGAITPHAALGPADASVLHAHAHALGAREGQQPDIQRADPAHNASIAHSLDQLGHSNQMDAGMAPASGGGAGRVLRVAGDVGEALDLDLSVEEVEAAQRRAGRRGWGWLGRR